MDAKPENPRTKERAASFSERGRGEEESVRHPAVISKNPFAIPEKAAGEMKSRPGKSAERKERKENSPKKSSIFKTTKKKTTSATIIKMLSRAFSGGFQEHVGLKKYRGGRVPGFCPVPVCFSRKPGQKNPREGKPR